MAKYYPHKQTMIIAIVCILAVAGTAGYVYSQKGTVSQHEIAVSADIQAAPNDEIMTNVDWKKQFFDVSKSSSAKNTSLASSSDAPLTLTDKVGRDFFARYIQLKQNNLDGNDQLVQGIIEQTLEGAQAQASQPKSYSLKDIKISDDLSIEALRAYGNTVAAVMNTYGPKTNPADVAYAAFDKNDMSMLKEIDAISAGFKKVSDTLLLVPAPRPLINDHLLLINKISALSGISQDIRNLEGDPMQSLVSLSAYGSAQSGVLTALYDMQAYFASKKVAFASTEAGTLFTLIKQ